MMIKIRENRIDTDSISHYDMWIDNKNGGRIDIYFKGDHNDYTRLSYTDVDELFAVVKYLDKIKEVQELKYIKKEVAESQIELIKIK